MKATGHNKKTEVAAFIITDDSRGNIRRFWVSSDRFKAFLTALLITILIFLIKMSYDSAALKGSRSELIVTKGRLEQMTQENEKLKSDISALQEKVSIFSTTITQQAQDVEAKEAEEESRFIPSGFPLSGTGVILESSETKKTDETEETDAGKDPIVVMSADNGINIIATASGKIAEVETDEEYGNRIVIDHGNGYKSIYRSHSTPKIGTGSDIIKGQILYELKSSTEKFAYQIIKDDGYIDPLELMEIYG